MPKDVPKFEHQNDISVNVYILQKKKERFIVAPIHITGQKRDRHVNQLFIQNYYADEEKPDNPVENDDEGPVRLHYVWIKDLSRLVSGQLSKHKCKHHICDRCLYYFVTEDNVSAPEMDCSNINDCAITLPFPGNDK